MSKVPSVAHIRSKHYWIGNRREVLPLCLSRLLLLLSLSRSPSSPRTTVQEFDRWPRLGQKSSNLGHLDQKGQYFDQRSSLSLILSTSLIQLCGVVLEQSETSSLLLQLLLIFLPSLLLWRVYATGLDGLVVPFHSY